MQWDRVKGFSALVTRHLKIDLRPILACHLSKIFLAMRGTTAPLQTPQIKNFSLMINSVWGLNRAFFHCLRPQSGLDNKLSKHVYMRKNSKG
jgi:hypothetical protein